MATRPWIRSLFSRKASPVSSRLALRGRARLGIESLEAREVPATFTVTSLLDDGSAGTLRWAVGQANATAGTDTINFAPAVAGGTITLTSGQLVLTDSARTTVDGGAAGVTLDGGNATRIVQVNSSASVAIDRLTFRNGSADNGGAVNNQGSLVITGCTLANNKASHSGGGLFSGTSSLMTMSDCKVTGNTADFGGGIAIVNGIFPKISNSTIAENTASFDGGGVHNLTTDLSISESTIADNTAGRDGGGARSSAGRMPVTGSTIARNSAGRSGGGISASDLVPITSSTIVGNSATLGGGLANLSKSATLTNTLVVGNTGTTFPEVHGGSFSGNYNLLEVPSGKTLGQIIQVDGDGIPLLAENGGPTRTVALVPGSPAIGAGQAGVTSTDQRGFLRNANPDIGAFETLVPTVTVTAAGGEYNGTPFGANTVNVSGLGGQALASLGSPAVALTYTNSKTGAVLSGPPTDAGNYTVRAAFTSNIAGYRDAASAPVAFTIFRARTQLTLTASNASYSGSAYAGATATLQFFRNGSLISVAGTELEGVNVIWDYTGPDASSITPPVNVGSYVVKAMFLGSSNYTPTTSFTIRFSITPATLTVAADADANTPAPDAFNRAYGDADPALTYRVTGLVGSDTASSVLSGTPVRAGGENAGQYAVSVGSLFVVNPNYTLAFSPAAFTISPRTLTATATATGRVYDGTTAASATLTFGNAAFGETPTATFTAAFRDKNVGADKPVDVTGIVLDAAYATNYSLNGAGVVTTIAGITPKAVAGTFTASGRAYDGTTAATVLSQTVNGTVAGDAVALAGGVASFADKNAGADKPVAWTGAGLTGPDAGNYTLTGVAPTTATITPRALTVTANAANKVYDGTTAASVTLSDNRLAGDLFAVGYASATFATPDVGTNKPVTVAGIALNGADAGNYAANSTAIATASITPAFTTVTLTGDRPVAVPGLPVTFTAAVDAIGGGAVNGTVTFRDGTTVLGTVAVTNGFARLTTDALQAGNHQVTATFAGSLTGPATPPSVNVSVVPPAILSDPVSGQNALFVGGTAGDDDIRVKRKGNHRYEVEIETGRGCIANEFEQEFSGPISRIVIYAGAGDDVVDIDGNVRVPVYEFGGAGCDILLGAENAPNVLVGGTGNDLLYAGNARDILIGGAGNDFLFGKGGDDLLIAGSTAFDANETAMWGIQLEWTSDHSFATRVANLRGTGTGPRAKGTNVLTSSGPSKTVFDDGSTDFLKGGNDRNWYFANTSGGGVLDVIARLNGDDYFDDLG